MTIRHQPVTPLPWQTELDLDSVDIVGPLEQHLFIGRGGSETLEERAKDSDYAVHAANAYPKLVEALRETSKELRGLAEKFSLSSPGAEHDADALLRDLGEGAP